MERKGCNLGTKTDLVCNLKEIPRVRAGHIGNAANLPLAPQKAIVVEFWDAVEVYSVDRDHTALPQAGQGRDDHITTRSKGDGTIECDWRAIAPASAPCGSQRGRQPANGSASSPDKHLKFPGAA